MKHILIGIILSLGLISSATAQTVANGPYYAVPAWDQTLPAAQRFIVLANMNSEAVLDRETGLVWERDPVTAHPFAFQGPWATAQQVCPQVWTGGRAGWRLPSFHELHSLFDPSIPTGSLALPAGHPFLNIVADRYWSATSAQQNQNVAWSTLFQGRTNGPLATKETIARIWCVRGGGPISVY